MLRPISPELVLFPDFWVSNIPRYFCCCSIYGDMYSSFTPCYLAIIHMKHNVKVSPLAPHAFLRCCLYIYIVFHVYDSKVTRGKGGIHVALYWAKTEYRGMIETQKSGDKTSSGEIGLNIRTLASPKVGQDQVSGGVSVLCWHAAPVANVIWKPFVIRFGNKVQISNRVKDWWNAWSMEGVTVDGHHLECRVTFGRGGPHIVW